MHTYLQSAMHYSKPYAEPPMRCMRFPITCSPRPRDMRLTSHVAIMYHVPFAWRVPGTFTAPYAPPCASALSPLHMDMRTCEALVSTHRRWSRSDRPNKWPSRMKVVCLGQPSVCVSLLSAPGLRLAVVDRFARCIAPLLAPYLPWAVNSVRCRAAECQN